MGGKGILPERWPSFLPGEPAGFSAASQLTDALHADRIGAFSIPQHRSGRVRFSPILMDPCSR